MIISKPSEKTYLVTRIFSNTYIPMCFPKFTAPPKNEGSIWKVISERVHFFKTYKDKKKLKSSLGKNSENYETVHSETNMYEQRPTNIDDFIEDEEKQVKERVEKRKQKRGDVAKKKKL